MDQWAWALLLLPLPCTSEALFHPCTGTDPVPPLLQVTLLSEGLLHTLEAAACPPLDLHATFTPEAQEATTMDQSLLLLTAHLAEARGGQGPLVADAFNTACPKNNNQTLVNAEGAQSGAVNAP